MGSEYRDHQTEIDFIRRKQNELEQEREQLSKQRHERQMKMLDVFHRNSASPPLAERVSALIADSIPPPPPPLPVRSVSPAPYQAPAAPNLPPPPPPVSLPPPPPPTFTYPRPTPPPPAPTVTPPRSPSPTMPLGGRPFYAPAPPRFTEHVVSRSWSPPPVTYEISSFNLPPNIPPAPRPLAPPPLTVGFPPHPPAWTPPIGFPSPVEPLSLSPPRGLADLTADAVKRAAVNVGGIGNASLMLPHHYPGIHYPPLFAAPQFSANMHSVDIQRALPPTVLNSQPQSFVVAPAPPTGAQTVSPPAAPTLSPPRATQVPGSDPESIDSYYRYASEQLADLGESINKPGLHFDDNGMCVVEVATSILIKVIFMADLPTHRCSLALLCPIMYKSPEVFTQAQQSALYQAALDDSLKPDSLQAYSVKIREGVLAVYSQVPVQPPGAMHGGAVRAFALLMSKHLPEVRRRVMNVVYKPEEAQKGRQIQPQQYAEAQHPQHAQLPAPQPIQQTITKQQPQPQPQTQPQEQQKIQQQAKQVQASIEPPTVDTSGVPRHMPRKSLPQAQIEAQVPHETKVAAPRQEANLRANVSPVASTQYTESRPMTRTASAAARAGERTATQQPPQQQQRGAAPTHSPHLSRSRSRHFSQSPPRARAVSRGREREREVEHAQAGGEESGGAPYASLGLQVTEGARIKGEFKRYTNGVVIVAAKGSAHQAGLRPNDIITRLNGVRVGGLADWRSAVSALRPGGVTTVTAERSGRVIQFDVVVQGSHTAPGDRKFRNYVNLSDVHV